ncbi:MAG: hypothetical protein KC591_11200 [Gemmatimonadetes bacterium]|nr:hypothetical protein [Gemmatimonadota bacterium]
MSTLRIALTLILLSASAVRVSAAPVPGLFPTGVDDFSAVLPASAADPHYALISSADPSYPGPDALVAALIPTGYWLANDGTSQWIAPNDDENFPALGTPHPGGDYVYRISFDLAGLDPATVTISGTWGVDNSGSILLNGAATGIGGATYSQLAPFTITSGFVAGVNHLDFVVQNFAASGSNPTGLRVGTLSGTGDPIVGVEAGIARDNFRLAPPFPNPMHGESRFAYSLTRSGQVRLSLRDVSGRTVRTLVEREQPAGRHEADWDGRATDGTTAPAGVYFVELEAEGHRTARRITLIR